MISNRARYFFKASLPEPKFCPVSPGSKHNFDILLTCQVLRISIYIGKSHMKYEEVSATAILSQSCQVLLVIYVMEDTRGASILASLRHYTLHISAIQEKFVPDRRTILPVAIDSLELNHQTIYLRQRSTTCAASKRVKGVSPRSRTECLLRLIIRSSTDSPTLETLRAFMLG